MKNAVKYIITFIITATICILSFILVTLIPNNLIKDNILTSAEYTYKLPAFIYFNNNKSLSTLIHNYPDPITMNLTYSLNPKKPISSIFLTKYYSTNKYTENVNFREKAIHDYEPNKEYYRYWHGNIVIVKLLLLVFDYKEILIFLSLILTTLIILITYQLFKRDKFIAVIFLVANLFIKVFITFCCLEYIYMFLLSYLLALISFKLINASEDKIICFFIIGGVLANFFDFLTTETLVFTLPFLIIYYFRYKDKKVDKKTFIFFIKAGLAFLLSYSMMWILKWLILVIFYGLKPKDFLNDHILERGINKNTFRLGFFDSIIINVKQLIPFCYFNNNIIVIVFFIIYIVYLLINFRKKIFGLKEGILILIGLIPMLRYLVMFMHSYDHCFFTYRALLPSIMIFFILLKVNCKKIKSYDKIKSKGKVRVK